MNGSAQLGAVTRPYNRQNVIVKGAEVLSPALRSATYGGLGVWSPRKFLYIRLSEMISDAIFKQKKGLPMPNQNNVEPFLKISYCKRNLSRQFRKDLMVGVTYVPHIIYTSLSLVKLAQPRDSAAGVITYKPPQQR